jgi:predicted porin
MTLSTTVKIAFALPALCLGAAAQAESPIRLSGMIDIGLYRGFDETKNIGTIQRSHIAIDGSEDLGGGLAATFKLQHRFDADTGGTESEGLKPFWHGESTVGLKGAFGHVRFGRALDVVYANDWAFDPWYNFDRIASPAWNNWHWNYATDRTSNDGTAEYGRLSNGVFYDSPAFSGFTVHFSGSFEDSSGVDGGTGDNAGLALNYDQGPLALMVAGSRNSSGDTVQFLGAKYTFDALSVMGAYDRSVYDGPTDSTAKVYTLGASYAIGAGNLKAGFGHRDVDGAKSRFLGLGADYGLSKRTSVYVSLGRQDPDGGDASTAYGVGMSHSF